MAQAKRFLSCRKADSPRRGQNVSILVVMVFLSLEALIAGAAFHHENYFQQYVHYDIDVTLDTDVNVLEVNEQLLYVNNSPDTLSEIYFHLYMNKYRRHSLTYPDQTEDRGWIEIIDLVENEAVRNEFTVDHTLMNVPLAHPLTPGDSVRFDFRFQVKLPPAAGRYGYQGLHYDVGNWYVTPVVYDRAGWHLHQHLDNEFYQEWGDFNVTIRVPQDFRVGATGNLQNASEVYAMLDSSDSEY